ncbi:MAG: YDG domain-containing protein [Clostridia bacterium]|nr:YDG domain-containing protein [Clostridia bacterium]
MDDMQNRENTHVPPYEKRTEGFTLPERHLSYDEMKYLGEEFHSYDDEYVLGNLSESEKAEVAIQNERAAKNNKIIGDAKKAGEDIRQLPLSDMRASDWKLAPDTDYSENYDERSFPDRTVFEKRSNVDFSSGQAHGFNTENSDGSSFDTSNARNERGFVDGESTRNERGFVDGNSFDKASMSDGEKMRERKNLEDMIVQNREAQASSVTLNVGAPEHSFVNRANDYPNAAIEDVKAQNVLTAARNELRNKLAEEYAPSASNLTPDYESETSDRNLYTKASEYDIDHTQRQEVERSVEAEGVFSDVNNVFYASNVNPVNLMEATDTINSAFPLSTPVGTGAVETAAPLEVNGFEPAELVSDELASADLTYSDNINKLKQNDASIYTGADGLENRVKPIREKEGGLWLWIAVAIVGIVLVFLLFGCAARKYEMSISGTSTVTVNQSQTYKLQAEGELKDDDVVIWSVNGAEAARYSYSESNFTFTPDKEGTYTISVCVEKVEGSAELKVTVQKPTISVVIDDKSMIYGEQMPELTYSVSGLSSQTRSSVLEISLAADVGEGKLSTGKYSITAVETPQLAGYNVKITNGTLTVAPKPIYLKGAVLKTYDGSAAVATTLTQSMLTDVIEGDVVNVSEGALIFGDKNVGSSTLSLANTELTGEDAANYYLSDDLSGCTGIIKTKTLVIKDLYANDKLYDGTDNVTFQNAGTIEGIVEGDSVTIGEITARFIDSKVGKNKPVIIENITLVGDDAQNYQAQVYDTVRASIIKYKRTY